VKRDRLSALGQQVAVADEHLRFLLDEIERYIPHATVWVFGSRITGSQRRTSDLDLAVHCDKESAKKDLPRLNEVFIESDLPFKVQILDYNRLPENMQGNIKEKYAVLYQPRKSQERE
jgi:type I restriction enzyme S subunit